MAGIKHVAVKVSGDKGYASEWNADHEIDGDVECAKYQHKEHVIENRTDWPAGPVEGQIIYRTDENKLYIWDGAAWADYEPAILHGTHYWSCAGVNFKSYFPDIHDISYSYDTGSVTTTADQLVLLAPVFLPQGAIVTAVIVFGNIVAGTEQWVLRRSTLIGAAMSGMAFANINVEDNTIDNPIIDNNTYYYWLRTSPFGVGDQVYGARIIYTL